MPQESVLESAVTTLLSGYRDKITGFDADGFLKTGVDPFRFKVNVGLYGLRRSVRKEIEHKVEMTLENLVGGFHENYLGNCEHVPTGTSWEIVPTGEIAGVDIRNRERQHYLQIKSKHNSMNSSSSARLAQKQ